MRTGKLNKFLSIEVKSRVSDGAGGYVEGWTELKKAWMSVTPLSGRERYQAQQIRPETSHKVVMRYSSGKGIDSSMRIKLDEKRYLYLDSPPINTNEKNKELQLLCTERSE